MQLADFIKNITSLFQTFSFYSPLIVVISIMFWGFVINAPIKSFVYFTLIVIITVFRMFLINGTTSGDLNAQDALPAICSQALNVPNDPTYSMNVLGFTLCYIVVPMMMLSNVTKSNSFNFGAVGFLAAYLFYDIGVKTQLGCVSAKNAIFSSVVGCLLGSAFGLLFYSSARSWIFINDASSNSEVCSMPTKQQFKCKLYKNGELVTN